MSGIGEPLQLQWRNSLRNVDKGLGKKAKSFTHWHSPMRDETRGSSKHDAEYAPCFLIGGFLTLPLSLLHEQCLSLNSGAVQYSLPLKLVFRV